MSQEITNGLIVDSVTASDESNFDLFLRRITASSRENARVIKIEPSASNAYDINFYANRKRSYELRISKNAYEYNLLLKNDGDVINIYENIDNEEIKRSVFSYETLSMAYHFCYDTIRCNQTRTSKIQFEKHYKAILKDSSAITEFNLLDFIKLVEFQKKHKLQEAIEIEKFFVSINYLSNYYERDCNEC